MTWDGKVDMSPFGEELPTQRSSNNKLACTLQSNVISPIIRDRMRDKPINYVLQAIMAKWPAHISKVIYKLMPSHI